MKKRKKGRRFIISAVRKLPELRAIKTEPEALTNAETPGGFGEGAGESSNIKKRTCGSYG